MQTIDDENWLSEVEAGYIGLVDPQVTKVADPYKDIPYWYLRQIEKESKKEELGLDEYMDKYKLSGDPDRDIDYSEWDAGMWEDKP